MSHRTPPGPEPESGVPGPDGPDGPDGLEDLEAQARWWAHTDDPASLPARCPDGLVSYLATGWGAGRWFGAIVANPAVPDTARVALAAGLSGFRKKHLVSDLVEYRAAPSAWVSMARALTASRFAQGLRVLHDTGLDPRPWADDARRAAIIAAFAASEDPRARGLVAEACELCTAVAHDPAAGTLSAPLLVADPAVGVRVALTRNLALRTLAEDQAGLAVRQRLLDDPHDRVRTAARRNGVAVLDRDLRAALEACWARYGMGDDPRPPAAPDEPASPPATPEPESEPETEQAPAHEAPSLQVGDPLDDPSPRVRATAAGTILLGDDARWARLLADPSPQVRVAAIRWGFLTAQRWAQLAGDAHWRVRYQVAASGRAPAGVLRRLVHDPDQRVADAASQVVFDAAAAATVAEAESLLRGPRPW